MKQKASEAGRERRKCVLTSIFLHHYVSVCECEGIFCAHSTRDKVTQAWLLSREKGEGKSMSSARSMSKYDMNPNTQPHLNNLNPACLARSLQYLMKITLLISTPNGIKSFCLSQNSYVLSRAKYNILMRMVGFTIIKDMCYNSHNRFAFSFIITKERELSACFLSL
jgi:hypothetical protein